MFFDLSRQYFIDVWVSLLECIKGGWKEVVAAYSSDVFDYYGSQVSFVP